MVNLESPVNNRYEELMIAQPPCKRCRRREPLIAHVFQLTEDSMAFVRAEFDKMENMYLSLSELISYIFDDAYDLLTEERRNICVQFFGFAIIHHSPLLVQFYTGLPDAASFCYVNSLLQREVDKDYIKWESHEKHGFLNHTMMCLMKLRLGMTDEELAERFQVETYVVNMTMRTWLPALYRHIYIASQELHRYPVPHSRETYTKIIDVVEVCLETPRLREGRHQPRHAVLSVRSDGFVCFAGDVLSEHVPQDALIKRSKFGSTLIENDVILAHPELQSTVSLLGVTCFYMTQAAHDVIERTVDLIADYKILAAIPLEYASFASDIFKTCAALSNFLLPPPEDDD
ncbi:hypothetical protein GE061_016885 [Apolygus lucorum]|uniref:Transposase Helix-turn-helix domain-containing protein n=1 Tax=Apolygus lucorum TaxID=248454 RepID=A0A8S9XIJ9_APOLU|nr:hypothetical protein GE061_016885 [Apolygus lucorum]